MNISDYSNKVNWLFNQFPVFQKVGAKAYKPTLDNTKSLISFFSIPIDEMSFVHVAGTNGKGTTCSIVASALTESGKKVGLFTSPHIKDFRERIRVNGKMISENEVVHYINMVQSHSFEFSPSFFEITWAMALAHFYKMDCDVVVVETGLGGRLDATNVIIPELSIITNIGLDHVAILGGTRKLIAGEKAGIIKKGVPVVIGEGDEEVAPVFKEVAEAIGAPIYFLENLQEVDAFQQNSNLAFKALDILLGDISGKETLYRNAISKLYENTGLFGRSQVYSESPLIILDAAHNPMGVEKLIRNIQLNYSYRNVRVLYGTSNDKDLDAILGLFPVEWKYFFTEFSNNRSTRIQDLKKNSNVKQLNAKYFLNAKKAFTEAKSIESELDMLVVFGSFFLLEDII